MSIPAELSIDLKKSRMRVHKAMLHQLGDPQYIQLLVNPDNRAIAILAVDKPHTKDPVHKVTEKKLHSDFSYEIYSSSFLLGIRSLEPRLDELTCFRLSGEVFPERRMAVFSLKTLRRVDAQGSVINE